jgi:peptide chain release factor 3
VVIDVAKGRGTNERISLRKNAKIPIIIFINKMDREGKDAFDLMDEVEQN